MEENPTVEQEVNVDLGSNIPEDEGEGEEPEEDEEEETDDEDAGADDDAPELDTEI